MSGPVKALIVEDSENDVLLIVGQLEQAGYTIHYERVDTGPAMRAAIQSQRWDLVISDFSMPHFSGTAALAICKETNLDVPFVIVSAQIGEEAAVDMMRAGAHDYVRKDNLARLAPAIERELKAAQERRRRERAEVMMSHLAAIVESCDDAIISKTLDGVVLSWNAAAERTYGHTALEMIGQPISRLIPRHRNEEWNTVCNKIKDGQRVVHLETVHLRKDVHIVHVSITVSPVRDGEGRIVGASIVAHDISRRKQSEIERLQLIQELTDALAQNKTLRGLFPMCASCKRIRNDDGYWEQVESYISSRSEAEFTHGICPDCMKQLYSEADPKDQPV